MLDCREPAGIPLAHRMTTQVPVVNDSCGDKAHFVLVAFIAIVFAVIGAYPENEK